MATRKTLVLLAALGIGILAAPDASAAAPFHAIQRADDAAFCVSFTGDQVAQNLCTGSNYQIFFHDATPNDVNGVEILNYSTNKCVAVAAGSKANGAKVILWPCDNGPEQTWFLEPVSSPLIGDVIKNKNSGLCLAVPGDSTVNWTQLIQWTCNGHVEQVWDFSDDY